MTPITTARGRDVRSAAVLAALLVAFSAALAGAQQPAPFPAPKAPPPKAAPKQPAPQQPAQVQPAPAPAPQQQLTAAPAVPLVYSPWVKICQKVPAGVPDPQICLTLREARLETGQLMAAAALVERAGDPKKLIRVTLPLGVQLAAGTRLTLDSDQPASAAYVMCTPGGCLSDYDVTPDYIEKLKKGQNMILQGVNTIGQVASYALPLADFAKANEGAPTDGDAFAASQKKFWEDKLKTQQPVAPPK